MLTNRTGLAIWLHSLKYIKQLRKFGNIHYVSKRMKYAVLYCDTAQKERIIEKIEKLHFVKKVEPSHKAHIKTEYQNAMPDKAKEYDYKIGL
ncbi:YlbG family protein [Pseudalkalibacillus sp. Hm43]|uniref:YlbG family protein n=1 Tax=Pseudalkalibacillus sp. Hm43 TaxID=3450742 RepID=UPI003F42E8E5